MPLYYISELFLLFSISLPLPVVLLNLRLLAIHLYHCEYFLLLQGLEWKSTYDKLTIKTINLRNYAKFSLIAFQIM